jgi:F-type H+-transporting ATPase subunit epsilon
LAGLEVHVVSPEREVWSGEGELVVAKGVEGDVGIMVGHAPMLVSLAVSPIRVTQPGGDQRMILVDGGFLHVTSADEGTRIDVLAEHAVLPEDVDVAAARARVEELRSMDLAEAELKAELAKALMRAEFGQG